MRTFSSTKLTDNTIPSLFGSIHSSPIQWRTLVRPEGTVVHWTPLQRMQRRDISNNYDNSYNRLLCSRFTMMAPPLDLLLLVHSLRTKQIMMPLHHFSLP